MCSGVTAHEIFLFLWNNKGVFLLDLVVVEGMPIPKEVYMSPTRWILESLQKKYFANFSTGTDLFDLVHEMFKMRFSFVVNLRITSDRDPYSGRRSPPRFIFVRGLFGYCCCRLRGECCFRHVGIRAQPVLVWSVVWMPFVQAVSTAVILAWIHIKWELIVEINGRFWWRRQPFLVQKNLEHNYVTQQRQQHIRLNTEFSIKWFKNCLMCSPQGADVHY